MATIWDPKGDGSNTNLNDLVSVPRYYVHFPFGESVFYEWVDEGTNDTIYGLGGHDVITVHNGNDTVYGGDGDDVIVDAGNGNDKLYGNAGYDTFVAGSGVNHLDGGAGQDAVSYEAIGHGVTVDLLPGLGNIVYGTTGVTSGDYLANIENVHGSAYGDVIKGDNLANYLDGAAGHDRLEGRDGDDFLEGGSGQDILDGGVGNDSLKGGSDRDILTGGSGADRFLFTTTNDSPSALYADLITDFTQGSHVWKYFLPMDKIDVSEIDARTDMAGNNTFAFIGQNAFTPGRSGEIRFFQADGNTYVQFNTDLNASPEMTVKLNGLYNLTAFDFAL